MSAKLKRASKPPSSSSEAFGSDRVSDDKLSQTEAGSVQEPCGGNEEQSVGSLRSRGNLPKSRIEPGTEVLFDVEQECKLSDGLSCDGEQRPSSNIDRPPLNLGPEVKWLDNRPGAEEGATTRANSRPDWATKACTGFAPLLILLLGPDIDDSGPLSVARAPEGDRNECVIKLYESLRAPPVEDPNAGRGMLSSKISEASTFLGSFMRKPAALSIISQKSEI